jgi:hypothetical protein
MQALNDAPVVATPCRPNPPAPLAVTVSNSSVRKPALLAKALTPSKPMLLKLPLVTVIRELLPAPSTKVDSPKLAGPPGLVLSPGVLVNVRLTVAPDSATTSAALEPAPFWPASRRLLSVMTALRTPPFEPARYTPSSPA